MINSNKIFEAIIFLIAITFYVFIINYLKINISFFEFILQSPDILYFNNIIEDITNNDLLNIFDGSYPINVQVDYFFSSSLEKLIINISFLYISIYLIGHLINFYYNLNKYLALLILFLPSFVYIFMLNLKDFYLFFAITLFCYTFHRFNTFNFYKNINLNILNCLFLLLLTAVTTYFFYFTKFYILFYLITSITLFNFLFLFIKKIQKIEIKFNILFCTLIFFLSYILIYLIFTRSNVLGAALIIGEGGYFSDYEKKQLLWNYSFYIPDFIENIFKKFTSIRYHFIDYNISINANTIVTQNIIPKSIFDFFYHFPYLFFKSILSINLLFNSEKNILYLALIFEQLIICFSLIFFVFNRNKNFLVYFLTFVFLSTSFLYFYANPNLGTFYRYKAIFQIPIILLSFSSIDYFIRKIIYKNIIKSFNLNLNIILLISSAVLLFLIRDIIIFNLVENVYFLQFTVFSLILLSLFSHLVTSPTISTLLIYNLKKDYSFINGYLMTIFFFILSFVFLLVLGINFKDQYAQLYKENFFYLFLLFLSVPINAILSSFMIRHDKKIKIFSLQLIVPILTLLILIFNFSPIINLFLIMVISTYLYSFTMLISVIRDLSFREIRKISFQRKIKILISFSNKIISNFSLQSLLFLYLVLILFFNNLILTNAVNNYFIIKLILFVLGFFNLYLAYNENYLHKHKDLLSHYILINFASYLMLVFIFIFYSPIISFFLINQSFYNLNYDQTFYIFLIIPNLLFFILLIKSEMILNVKKISLFFITLLSMFLIICFSLLIENVIFKISIAITISFLLNLSVIRKVNILLFIMYALVTVVFTIINYFNYLLLIENQNYSLSYIINSIPFLMIFIWRKKLKI